MSSSRWDHMGSSDMTSPGTGTLIGIARRTGRRAPMERLQTATVVAGVGLTGDPVGPRHPRRLVTVLAIEDWTAALAALNANDLFGATGGATSAGIDLAWTDRRANLLVEGVRLPRAKGAILRVDGVELVVTGQTHPCARMDSVHPGLLKALGRDWRGGVTCAVNSGGEIACGARVWLVSSPPEQRADRLPG
jgi:MOSC domain-containing protein YiiM